MTLCGGLLCLPGQEGERSLEAGGKVAGFGLSPPHGVFAMIQERVQVIHQGLNFVGIAAFDPGRLAVTYPGQTFAQIFEGRDAAPRVGQARDHQAHSEDSQSCAV